MPGACQSHERISSCTPIRGILREYAFPIRTGRRDANPRLPWNSGVPPSQTGSLPRIAERIAFPFFAGPAARIFSCSITVRSLTSPIPTSRSVLQKKPASLPFLFPYSVIITVTSAYCGSASRKTTRPWNKPLNAFATFERSHVTSHRPASKPTFAGRILQPTGNCYPG